MRSTSEPGLHPQHSYVERAQLKEILRVLRRGGLDNRLIDQVSFR